jgi:hypothetical protein
MKTTLKERYQEVAQALIDEAAVVKVEFHDKGLFGRAWTKEGRILVPRPITLRRLYITAHECGHIAKEHDWSDTRHREEFEAEKWAHEALERHGLKVPLKSTAQAKRYVGHKIRQAIIRKAKFIDREALVWCYDGMTERQQIVFDNWLLRGGQLI